MQAAEGAIFAFVPLVRRAITGEVAGIVGAYGNAGAIIFLIVFTFLSATAFFLILGVCCLLLLGLIFYLDEPRNFITQIMPDGTLLKIMAALKVLVIDEFDTDHLIANSLQQYGYEIAKLGLRALNLVDVVKTLKPDVVVLNLYTPDERVLAMMRDINAQHSVPVVMFAEDQQTETINQVIKAGVSA